MGVVMYQVYGDYKQNWLNDKQHMQAHTSFRHLLDMLLKLKLDCHVHLLHIALSAAPIYHQYTEKYRNH